MQYGTSTKNLAEPYHFVLLRAELVGKSRNRCYRRHHSARPPIHHAFSRIICQVVSARDSWHVLARFDSATLPMVANRRVGAVISESCRYGLLPLRPTPLWPRLLTGPAAATEGLRAGRPRRPAVIGTGPLRRPGHNAVLSECNRGEAISSQLTSRP